MRIIAERRENNAKSFVNKDRKNQKQSVNPTSTRNLAASSENSIGEASALHKTFSFNKNHNDSKLEMNQAIL